MEQGGFRGARDTYLRSHIFIAPPCGDVPESGTAPLCFDVSHSISNARHHTASHRMSSQLRPPSTMTTTWHGGTICVCYESISLAHAAIRIHDFPQAHNRRTFAFTKLRPMYTRARAELHNATRHDAHHSKCNRSRVHLCAQSCDCDNPRTRQARIRTHNLNVLARKLYSANTFACAQRRSSVE